MPRSLEYFKEIHQATTTKPEKPRDFAIERYVSYDQVNSTLTQLPSQVRECCTSIQNRNDLHNYQAQATLTLDRTSLNLEAANAHLQHVSSIERSDLLDRLATQVNHVEQCVNNFSKSISESPDKVGQALEELDQANKPLGQIREQHIKNQLGEVNSGSTSGQEQVASTSQEKQTSIAEKCLDEIKGRKDLDKKVSGKATLILQRTSLNLDVFDKYSQLIRSETEQDMPLSVQEKVRTLKDRFEEFSKNIPEDQDDLTAALDDLQKKNKPLDEIRNQMKEILSKTSSAGQGVSTLERPSVTPEDCLDKIRNSSNLKEYWHPATLILARTEANLSIFNQYLNNGQNEYQLSLDDVHARLNKLQTCTENLSQNISKSPSGVEKALKELKVANKEANELLPVIEATPDNSDRTGQRSTVDAQRQERMREIETFLRPWDNSNPEARTRIIGSVRDNNRMGNIADTEIDFLNEIEDMRDGYQEYQQKERIQRIRSFLHIWDNSDGLSRVRIMKALDVRRGDSGDAERIQNFRREIENIRREYREHQGNQ